MSYPTQEEIKDFIATHGLTDEDLCVKERLDPDEDCSEMGINLGYIWSFGYNCWFDKDKRYSDKEEQILELFKNDGNFKLPVSTRKVTVTVTRYYSKQTEVELDVPSDVTEDELQDYLTNNEELDELAENGLGEASLVGDDTKWEYQDPTNGTGGHL